MWKIDAGVAARPLAQGERRNRVVRGLQDQAPTYVALLEDLGCGVLASACYQSLLHLPSQDLGWVMTIDLVDRQMLADGVGRGTLASPTAPDRTNP